MAYHDTIQAHRTMLEDAETMYENDLKNTMIRNEGNDIDTIENEIHIRAIKKKLDELNEEKDKALVQKDEEYTHNSNHLGSLYNDGYKTDVILNKQNKEMSYNDKKLKNIGSDIDILERQLEISLNETLRRNNKIFMLKSFFVFLLVALAPLVLYKGNHISKKTLIILMSVLLLILIIVTLTSYWVNRNRIKRDYEVKTWKKMDADDSGVSDSEELTPIDQLLKDLEEKKTFAVENNDYKTAEEVQIMIDEIHEQQNSETDDGGTTYDADKINKIRNEYLSDEAEYKEKIHKEKNNQIQKIKRAIKKREEAKNRFYKELDENENEEKGIRDTIDGIQSNIDRMVQDLENLENSNNLYE